MSVMFQILGKHCRRTAFVNFLLLFYLLHLHLLHFLGRTPVHFIISGIFGLLSCAEERIFQPIEIDNFRLLLAASFPDCNRQMF